jgi:hypothetical protein
MASFQDDITRDYPRRADPFDRAWQRLRAVIPGFVAGVLF